MATTKLEYRSRIVEKLIKDYFFKGKEIKMSPSIDNMLDVLEVWFGKNNLQWHIDKVIEEYTETKEAYESWVKDKNEFTKFHVMVEVSDFIAAFSAIVQRITFSYKLDTFKEVNMDFPNMINSIIDIIRLVGITEDEVIANIESKSTEIFIGVNTYTKLKQGDTTELFCRIIRTLYTDKEINDINNEKKIVKEIRRMWYAREFKNILNKNEIIGGVYNGNTKYR